MFAWHSGAGRIAAVVVIATVILLGADDTRSEKGGVVHPATAPPGAFETPFGQLIVERRLPGNYYLLPGGWCQGRDVAALRGSDDRSIYVWEFMDGQALPRRIGAGSPHRVAWSRDGGWLAWTCPDPESPLGSRRVMVAPVDGARAAIVFEDEGAMAVEWNSEDELLVWDDEGNHRMVPLLRDSTGRPLPDSTRGVRLLSAPWLRATGQLQTVFALLPSGIRSFEVDWAGWIDFPTSMLAAVDVFPGGGKFLATTFAPTVVFATLDSTGRVSGRIPAPTIHVSGHNAQLSRDGRRVYCNTVRDSGEVAVVSHAVALNLATGRLDTLLAGVRCSFAGRSSVSDRIALYGDRELIIARWAIR